MFLKFLSPLLQYFQIDEVDIYNTVFKLHCKLTSNLLLIFSALLSAHDFFGQPINCLGDVTKIQPFVNNICWVNGTYTIKNSNGTIGKHLISHGVGSRKPGDQLSYQRYYQWVVVVLLLEAILFYVPAYMWKIWENKRLQMLCKDLNMGIDCEAIAKRKQQIVKYLLSGMYSSTHSIYAIRFFVCEIMNFICIIFNMAILNMVFSGFWFEYAPAIHSLFTDWSTWDRNASKLFPKMAKCDFYSFGASGSIENKDAICLLSTNIVNEKIFAFIWIWFIVLLAISGLNLMYRLLCVLSKSFRIKMLKSMAMSLSYGQIIGASRDGRIGEWFILTQLGRNYDHVLFKELMEALSSNARCENGKQQKISSFV